MRTALAAMVAVAIATLTGPVIVPETAFAAEGTEEGIGARKGYQFEERRLNDRMVAKVNVATGNLLLDEKDLTISGTGLSLDVSRHYNSLSTAPSPTGPGWVMSIGHDVRLDVEGESVVFRAPSGYQVTFTEGADGFTAEEPGFDATLTRRDQGGFELEWRSKEKWLFDASGKWTTQEDANGNTIRFDYVTSPDTGKQPALASVTDTRGRSVTFEYAKGRLESMWDAAGGRRFSYTHDRSTTERLTSFAVTSYGLGTDNVNRNAETTFDYDESDRLVRVTDPRGNATTFSYQPGERRVASMTQVLDASSGAAATTRFTYRSELDKCAGEAEAVAETRVDGPRTDVDDVTTYCVDEHDRVVATVDAKGHKAGKKYTSNSNVAQLNESGVAGGPSYNFSFSQEDDNLTGVSLPTGGQASLDYQDSANQHLPTAVTDFAAGPEAAATWIYDYDDNGNLIEADNPVEDVTYRYCHNGDGTLARVAQPDLDGLPLDNDTSGDSCSGHAQGNDTLLTYNGAGEMVRLDPPGPTRTQTFTYDALSRVKTRTDGRGVVQTFTYDALDRVVEVRYDGPSTGTVSSRSTATRESTYLVPPDDDDAKQTWIKYSYDANGNMVARSDASGNTTFQFDALNRMTKESPESPSAVVTYTYDKAGNVTSILTSDAPRPVSYEFDETNLTTQVTDPEGRVTRFSYDNNGNRTDTAYPNGVHMEARYDDASRMTCTFAYAGAAPGSSEDSCPEPSTGLTTFREYSYQATLAGVPTDTNRRETATDRTGAVTSYGYDGIGRLVRATTTGGDGVVTRRHDYTYDDRSNLTREDVTGSQAVNEVRSQAYDGANQLCWVAAGAHPSDCGQVPAGAQRHDYDAAGNLIGVESGLQLGYSLRGHTISVTPPGLEAIQMEYTDATQDRRVEYDGVRMSYSQLGLVSQGPTNGSSKATWFVRDPHQKLVGMLHADGTKEDLYYLFDGLGSVIATTGSGGQVVQRYDYEPYGEQIEPAANDANPWRFAAGYHDAATGMVKFGTRYYMPDVARWTQPDPVQGELRNPVTLNAYGYVGSDPVNYVDPSGRWLDEILTSVDNLMLAGEVGGIFEGGVTWEEVGIFAASEAAGLVTESACMFAAGYFTAGVGLAFATAGCWALGAGASYGVEEALS